MDTQLSAELTLLLSHPSNTLNVCVALGPWAFSSYMVLHVCGMQPRYVSQPRTTLLLQTHTLSMWGQALDVDGKTFCFELWFKLLCFLVIGRFQAVSKRKKNVKKEEDKIALRLLNRRDATPWPRAKCCFPRNSAHSVSADEWKGLWRGWTTAYPTPNQTVCWEMDTSFPM